MCTVRNPFTVNNTKTELKENLSVSAAMVHDKTRPLLQKLKVPVAVSAASSAMILLGTEDQIR